MILVVGTAIGDAQAHDSGAAGQLTRAGITIRLAAESALTGNPLLLLQRAQVDAANGQYLLASAAFDPVASAQLGQTWLSQPLTAYQAASVASATFNGTLERSSETLLSSDLSWLFRRGFTLGGHFQLERLLDNVTSPSGDNFSNFSLSGTLPLLRSRRKEVVTAQEAASRLEVDASRNDVGQQASQLLQTIASTYWSLVASQSNLAILQGSEERARTYLSNVETLVRADQTPRGDLSQVEANLAQRSSQRIVAEQEVKAAEQQLALAIGLSPQEVDVISLAAGDDFPAVLPEKETAEMLATAPATLAYALSRREDYIASQTRILEQKRLEVAGRDALRPRLDLTGSAGYNGLQEGRKFLNAVDAAGAGIRGPNAQAALVFTFPIGNHAARGALMQTSAALRQAELRAEEIRQQISAEVRTSQSALLHASRQVVESQRGVAAATSALDGEKEKYRVGMGSIVDLVTVEDRLNTALSDLVQARYAFALAIAQLRFATNSFVQHNGDKLVLYDDAFIAVPRQP